MARSLVLLAALATAACARVGSIAARRASKGAAAAGSRSAAKVLARDAARDLRLIAKPLAKDRTVYRYTTKKVAEIEARSGIAAGKHMTARGGAGRPLSPAKAKAAYGLPRKPTVRETIKLPRGQPVRSGKVVGGRAGVGEITSTKNVDKRAIKRVVDIRPK